MRRANEPKIRKTGPPAVPRFRTKIFLVAPRMDHLRTIIASGYPYILVSYHYISGPIRKFGGFRKFFSLLGQDLDNFELMIDSGSYTATAKGIAIDLDDYIDFLNETKGDWTYCVNLDLQFKPKIGMRNYRRMAKAGYPQAIHAHHRPEAWKWWDKMCEECGDIVGLSPMPRAKMSIKDEYLGQAYSLQPWAKAHWFGSIAIQLLQKYDAFSADSSAAIFNAMNGVVLGTPFGPMTFGNRIDKRHFSHLEKKERKVLDDWLTHFNLTVELIAGYRYAFDRRLFLNAIHAKELLANIFDMKRENLAPHAELPDPDELRASREYRIDGEPPKGWK